MQASNIRNYKLGIVKEYDGYIGEIVTEDNLYYFTKNDINRNDSINVKDLVQFNSKCEELFPQAYYINKVYLEEIKYR